VEVHAFLTSLFAEHHAPYGHPEREARYHAAVRGIEQGVAESHLKRRETRPASHDELSRVHSDLLISRVMQAAGRTGSFDGDTYHSPQSTLVALHAAGAACQLVETLLSGEAEFGVVPSRPPGHHATTDASMGFCMLNNVAVAARAAQAMGAERVAIVDWDVHHGNGTEAIFSADPSVLYVSTHQCPLYPGTGAVSDAGEGAGLGKTVNIPLSQGADNAALAHAFERVVVPIVEQFAPDLLLISAGFDAHLRDPLGGLALDEIGFALLTHLLLSCMPERGRGRVGLVLEGGYHLSALQDSVASSMAALVSPPPIPTILSNPNFDVEIERARAVQATHWTL
jgi:acetoin utilization deacetylase AcuC-like enzyme